MKFFFIHKDRNVGKTDSKGKLNFFTTQEELKWCINKNIIHEYLKIPAFKEGDTVTIHNGLTGFLEKYKGAEYVVKSFNKKNGEIRFTEMTPDDLYIVDLQSL